MRRWRCLLWIGIAVFAIVEIGNSAEPPVTALAWDPAETQLLLGSQKGVQCYSWPDLKPSKAIETELKQVHEIAFSPNGKILAIAGGTPAEVGTVELWNWPDAKQPRSFSVHSDLVYQIAWSRDSQSLFTASHDADALQVSAKTGRIVRTFSGHSQPVSSLGVLNEEQILLTAGNDQTIRVWDIEEGKLVRSFNNHTGAIRRLEVRPQTDPESLPMIATIAADRTVRLWQPTIGRMVRFKRFSAAEPLSLAWSPAGATLYLTQSDGDLIELDADTLEILSTRETTVPQPINLKIAKDGKAAVVAGSRGNVQTIALKK